MVSAKRNTAPSCIFFACLVCFAVGFWGAAGGLVGAWATDEYSHGYLIPFIAAWIGWHRLVEQKPTFKPDAFGLVPLLFGILFLVISKLSAFEPPAQYGLWLGLIGLAQLFFGRAFVRTLAPSFIYLLFAIPLPRLIFVALSANMQLVSSTLGVVLLHLANISVYQDGNIIDLGNFQLQVAEACNGLRYLFPLMSFGFLISFLYRDKMWKRCVLFISTVPISIALNGLRIAIIGVTVDKWGIEMAEGFIHDAEGWVVFLVCVGILLLEMRLLIALRSPGSPKGAMRDDYFLLPLGPALTHPFSIRKSGFAGVTLCAVFAVFILSGTLDTRQDIIPNRTSFSAFPLTLGEWSGTVQQLTKVEEETLQLTDYASINYTKTNEKQPVQFYGAYYESQRVRSSIHSPNNCIPGSGWVVTEYDMVSLPLKDIAHPVTRMIVKKNDTTLLVYYWFQGRGRISNEQYGAKWFLFLDSVRLHRTDGALVRLTTPIGFGENPEDGDRRLQSLLDALTSLLPAYIPGK